MAPCSRASSLPSRLMSTIVGIELDLKRLLERASSVSARKQHRIVDTELAHGLGRTGLAVARRCRFLAGDADHLKSFAGELLLELDQVRDRLAARLAPASPEVEQDHVGVDVMKRHQFSAQVGKLEIDQAALGGIDAACALLDGFIDRLLAGRPATGPSLTWAADWCS